MFVCRVIESCETLDQLEVAKEWAEGVLTDLDWTNIYASIRLTTKRILRVCDAGRS